MLVVEPNSPLFDIFSQVGQHCVAWYRRGRQIIPRASIYQFVNGITWWLTCSSNNNTKFCYVVIQHHDLCANFENFNGDGQQFIWALYVDASTRHSLNFIARVCIVVVFHREILSPFHHYPLFDDFISLLLSYRFASATADVLQHFVHLACELLPEAPDDRQASLSAIQVCHVISFFFEYLR